MIRQFFITLCVIGFLVGMVTPPTPAHAQKTEYLEYDLAKRGETISDVLYKALSKDIEEYKAQFGNIRPYIRYAMTDLNGDGKPEIIARFADDYFQTDEFGKKKHTVFAYTSKGAIKILEVMAGRIAIGQKDKTGLRQIIAFQNTPAQFHVYGWDGKKQYRRVK